MSRCGLLSIVLDIRRWYGSSSNTCYTCATRYPAFMRTWSGKFKYGRRCTHSSSACQTISQHELLHLQSLECEEHNKREAATAALLNAQNSVDLCTDETPLKQRKGKRRLQTSQKRLCKVQGRSLAPHTFISHMIFSHNQQIKLCLHCSSSRQLRT